MISLEKIESVSLLSIWMLEPRLPELLLELGRRGYATARVWPKSLGGYDIRFIEPNVAAIKGSTYILYNPYRRTLIIKGSNIDEMLSIFNEVEEILRNIGSDPNKGVLFYELQAKIKANGEKWFLKKIIKVDNALGLRFLAIPTSFVSVKGDPNSTKWFHMNIKPVWTSWSDKKVYYEIVLIYRDSRNKLLNMLKNLNKILKNIFENIDKALNIS